jgi:hypothetical protein
MTASSVGAPVACIRWSRCEGCCQPGLHGVDVSWSGWKRRGGEQVSVIPEGRRATVRVLVLLLVVLTGCSAQPHVPRVSSSPSE